MIIKKGWCKLPAVVAFGVMLLCCGIAHAWTLPDTGQTKCYDNTQEITCPLPDEPFYGQDAQYGVNLQSFSDLGNGIVRDNVTGLEWQKATAPGFGSGSYPAKYTWQQAIDYCAGLNLGDKDDWRLPTIKELSTLVDRSILSPGPTIGPTFFYITWSANYWSSTIDAYYTDEAWQADFSNPNENSIFKTFYNYVRAVRSGQSNNNFIDNNDGTVTDTDTGLMWQQATAPGTYTWQKALAYCEGLTLANKCDWRLPNINELQSIVDYSIPQYTSPTINTTYFPITVASTYLSSTTDVDYMGGVWHINFVSGYMDSYPKVISTYVRAVRSAGEGGTCSATTTTTPNGTTTTTWPGGTTTTTTTISEGTIPCPIEIIFGQDDQNLNKLRSFRDNKLAQSTVGRKVIQIYYNNTSSINAALDHNPGLRAAVKRVLEVFASIVGEN